MFEQNLQKSIKWAHKNISSTTYIYPVVTCIPFGAKIKIFTINVEFNRWSFETCRKIYAQNRTEDIATHICESINYLCRLSSLLLARSQYFLLILHIITIQQ